MTTSSACMGSRLRLPVPPRPRIRRAPLRRSPATSPAQYSPLAGSRPGPRKAEGVRRRGRARTAGPRCLQGLPGPSAGHSSRKKPGPAAPDSPAADSVPGCRRSGRRSGLLDGGGGFLSRHDRHVERGRGLARPRRLDRRTHRAKQIEDRDDEFAPTADGCPVIEPPRRALVGKHAVLARVARPGPNRPKRLHPLHGPRLPLRPAAGGAGEKRAPTGAATPLRTIASPVARAGAISSGVVLGSRSTAFATATATVSRFASTPGRCCASPPGSPVPTPSASGCAQSPSS